ncbi:MAG TPA: hypothetical protein DEB39_13810 [Planctomycetaceae bacterium]|nr:hypothetical protein [Planctomycetaceae bacterium]
MSPSLTKALALYVHRRKQLPPRRREEIAMRLALPMLERCALPLRTNPDLFLCAVYHAIFAASLENPMADTDGIANTTGAGRERRTAAREPRETRSPTLPPMFIER